MPRHSKDDLIALIDDLDKRLRRFSTSSGVSRETRDQANKLRFALSMDRKQLTLLQPDISRMGKELDQVQKTVERLEKKFPPSPE